MRPGEAAALIEAQELIQRGHGPRLAEQIRQAVEQTIDHKQTDCQKCHELDHRLERNRRHHALVALRGVEMARAKHHGKTGQRQGHIKRAVVTPVLRVGRTGPGQGRQQRVTGRDRLELQRNIGNDADHGNQRDQARQQRALAIAAANEIGNGRDAVSLGDADHLAQHHPAQHHRQSRPEVNRQKPDSARSGAPDAAEISPCGAVDGQRQRIGPGVVDDRALLRRARVAKIGHGKEQQQVGKRGANDERGREHG